MRCAKIKKLLERYADGECSRIECRVIEQHLSKCPVCRSELQLLRSVDTMSRELSQPEPGEIYWNNFLPRLRIRIEEKERRSALGKPAYRIRRFFSPPVPWIRLAAAVSVAVLVLAVGRSLIRHEARMGPIRARPKQLLTDQIIQTEREKDEIQPQMKQTAAGDGQEKTAVSSQIASPSSEETIIPQDETSSHGDLSATAPTSPPKREVASSDIAPSIQVASPDGGAHPTAESADREGQYFTGADISAKKAKPEGIRTAAGKGQPDQWKDQVQRWQNMIDSESDESKRPAAYLHLADSWYEFARSTMLEKDLIAAIEAQQDALEYASEDSTEHLIRGRIQTLEELLQKN